MTVSWVWEWVGKWGCLRGRTTRSKILVALVELTNEVQTFRLAPESSHLQCMPMRIPSLPSEVRETHRISRITKSYPYQPNIDKKSLFMKAMNHCCYHILVIIHKYFSHGFLHVHPTSGIFSHAKTRTRAQDGTGMASCLFPSHFLPATYLTPQHFGIPALAATFKVTLRFL